MLLRLMLETCRTVEQALALARRVPIASAQTLTLADAGGAIAVLECNSSHLEVVRPAPGRPFVCATNTFHSPSMRHACRAGVDDWASEPRYQTMLHTLQAKADGMDIPGAMALLAGKEGFLCQYDKRGGRGTVWAAIYDVKCHAVWRAEGNPARRHFAQDGRFKF